MNMEAYFGYTISLSSVVYVFIYLHGYTSLED